MRVCVENKHLLLGFFGWCGRLYRLAPLQSGHIMVERRSMQQGSCLLLVLLLIRTDWSTPNHRHINKCVVYRCFIHICFSLNLFLCKCIHSFIDFWNIIYTYAHFWSPHNRKRFDMIAHARARPPRLSATITSFITKVHRACGDRDRRKVAYLCGACQRALASCSASAARASLTHTHTDRAHTHSHTKHSNCRCACANVIDRTNTAYNRLQFHFLPLYILLANMCFCTVAALSVDFDQTTAYLFIVWIQIDLSL